MFFKNLNQRLILKLLIYSIRALNFYTEKVLLKYSNVRGGCLLSLLVIFYLKSHDSLLYTETVSELLDSGGLGAAFGG